jgi:hypothetical protein
LFPFKKRGADKRVEDEDLENDDAESPIAAFKKTKAAPAPAKKRSKAGKAKQAAVEDDESHEDYPQVKDELDTDEGEENQE